MLRLAFLFLVILGALAALVSLFVGMGLYQAARLQEPAILPPTSATAQSAIPALATTRSSTAPASVIPRSAAVTAQPAAEPAAKPAVADVAIDRPVLLAARDAVLIGEDLRLDPVAMQTIVDWTNRRDGVEWTAQVPTAGLYDVEITYSCDRVDGGGVFTMRAGPGGISASVRPTSGWDDYQSLYVGKLYLQQGPTQLFIRPVYMLPGGKLMNLRAVTLKFVKQINEPDFRLPFSRRRGF